MCIPYNNNTSAALLCGNDAMTNWISSRRCFYPFLSSFVIIIISICYTLITCVDTISNDSILKMVYISISFCLVSFLFRLDWHISCNQFWSVPRLFRIVEHKSCSICRSLERERERGKKKSPEVAGFLSRVSTHVATRL